MEASEPDTDAVSDSAAAAECFFLPFSSPLLNVLKAQKIALVSQIGGNVFIRKKWGNSK